MHTGLSGKEIRSWALSPAPPGTHLVHSTALQLEARIRDLALFNLAIDSSEVATLSQSASTTWLPAATLRTGGPFGRKSLVDRSASS